MTVRRLTTRFLLPGLLLAGSTCILLYPGRAAEEPADPALERTRKQVKMLDDLYKTAIVLITENYVNESSDLAAGDAFQALFKTMKDKGWHEVRLIDATGQPYDDDNAPEEQVRTEGRRQVEGRRAMVRRDRHEERQALPAGRDSGPGGDAEMHDLPCSLSGSAQGPGDRCYRLYDSDRVTGSDQRSTCSRLL